MEPISLPSTFGMKSNANLQPYESTSKAQFQPKINTPKSKIEFFLFKESQRIQPFFNQFTTKKNSDWF